MSQRRHGRAKPAAGPTPEADTLVDKVVNNQLDTVTQAVHAAAQTGSLTARIRLDATWALCALVRSSATEAGAEAFHTCLGARPVALTALVEIHNMAIRTVAEAGGAARSAASRDQPSPLPRSPAAADDTTPNASDAGAWADTLYHSSTLIESCLSSTAVQQPPDNPLRTALGGVQPSGGIGTEAACSHVQSGAFKLLAVLLRSGALPALSRLLAAEVHRGTAAVLDTDTVMSALQPLSRIMDLACKYPSEPLQIGPAHCSAPPCSVRWRPAAWWSTCAGSR